MDPHAPPQEPAPDATPSQADGGQGEAAAPASAREVAAAAAGDVPGVPRRPILVAAREWLHDYFLGDRPTFALAVVPMCFLAMALFTRHPTRTNFIFDEQEALLANPYVRSVADAHPKFGWLDAFKRDFWGLGPERSIGSYRPIPDLVWRALWALGARDQTPFLHHWVNVLMHGVNGALVTVLAYRLLKRKGAAWFCGIAFTSAAVLTEAVSGVVGISDVLGATGAILAMLSLTLGLAWMVPTLILSLLFGLLSKESAMCCVPLVPFTALLAARTFHPNKPRPILRAAVAALVCIVTFVVYVEARRRLFPAPLPKELSVEANAHKGTLGRAFAAVLRWYAQPILPRDPLNNPLVKATGPFRVAGALRVYARGLGQVVFPWTLSGDYSAPQEPIPARLVFPESVLGALCLVLPIPVACWLGLRKRPPVDANDPEAPTPRAPVIGIGLAWIVLAYFPVSNIPVLLPTVRAERFWYFPVIGSSLVVGVALDALLRRLTATGRRRVGVAIVVAFFGFQCFAARRHANDYTDDLSFWDATRKAVPRSAKAHLNYSVMKGARNDLETRLASNKIALELAPQWPMASVYYADTLCRMHRAPEAIEHYKRGFSMGPNDLSLIALGLQCLWDEKMLVSGAPLRDELEALKDEHPGSWLDYLVRDILENGEKNNGVDPKQRPRGYNEGPKDG